MDDEDSRSKRPLSSPLQEQRQLQKLKIDESNADLKRISNNIINNIIYAISQEDPEFETNPLLRLPSSYLLQMVAKHGEIIRPDFVSLDYATNFVKVYKNIGNELQNAWKARSFEKILQLRAQLLL